MLNKIKLKNNLIHFINILCLLNRIDEYFCLSHLVVSICFLPFTFTLVSHNQKATEKF